MLTIVFLAIRALLSFGVIRLAVRQGMDDALRMNRELLSQRTGDDGDGDKARPPRSPSDRLLRPTLPRVARARELPHPAAKRIRHTRLSPRTAESRVPDHGDERTGPREFESRARRLWCRDNAVWDSSTCGATEEWSGVRICPRTKQLQSFARGWRTCLVDWR